MNRSKGQARADDTTKGAIGPGLIVNTELDAIGIAEIELGKVAMQMIFAAMLVNPAHPALEDGEEAFGAVHMGRAANVFLVLVVDSCPAKRLPICR